MTEGGSAPPRAPTSDTTCLMHVFFKNTNYVANYVSRIRQVMPQKRMRPY